MNTSMTNILKRLLFVIGATVGSALLLPSMILMPLSYILTGDKAWLAGRIFSFIEKFNPGARTKGASSQVLILEQDWESYHTFTCFMNNGTGMVSVSNYPDTKETYIHGLYMRDIFRRCGNATALLDEAEKYADYPIIVWVTQDAPEWLRRFYTHRGYTVKQDVVE